MRFLFAAALITVLMAPAAQAQFSSRDAKQKTPLDLIYERQERDQKENERQYNAQMKRLKAQGPTATSNDPWKGVRSTGDAKR